MSTLYGLVGHVQLSTSAEVRTADNGVVALTLTSTDISSCASLICNCCKLQMYFSESMHTRYIIIEGLAVGYLLLVV